MKIQIILVTFLTVSTANATGPVYFDDGVMTDAETGKQSVYTTDPDGTLWVLDSDEPRSNQNKYGDYYSNNNDRECKLRKRAGLPCDK